MSQTSKTTTKANKVKAKTKKKKRRMSLKTRLVNDKPIERLIFLQRLIFQKTWIKARQLLERIIKARLFQIENEGSRILKKAIEDMKKIHTTRKFFKLSLTEKILKFNRITRIKEGQIGDRRLI